MHAVSGLALGVMVPLGMGLTIVAALALHLGLDLVPHWDYTRDRRRLAWAAVDVAVAIVAVALPAALLDLPARPLVAAMASALPDLDVFDALLGHSVRRRLFPSHWRIFPHGEARPLFGVPVQVLVVCGSVATMLIWPL